MKRRFAIALAAIVLTASGAAAQVTGDSRATDLVAGAREALGGAAALARVGALTLAGSYTRDVQDRQLSGDLTIDLQLPDKMLRTETMSPMAGASVTIEQGFNGETLLQHSAATGGGPGAIFRMGGDSPDAQAQRLRSAKADAARLTLALLLTATSGLPLEASYAGEADSPDGKADVVDVKSGGGFAARLFLDRASHRPLMLTYRGVAPRIRLVNRKPGDAPPTASAEPPAAQAVDIAMFFDDYRRVDGIWLPHHISRSIGDRPNEEWTFTKIAVNPAFKPDTFQPK